MESLPSNYFMMNRANTIKSNSSKALVYFAHSILLNSCQLPPRLNLLMNAVPFLNKPLLN